jgi:GNAT superfamily N-acetyltransferase
VNDKGTAVGRIAAFVNQKTVNKDNDQPTGGVGFFECIENKEAAFILFDTAKSWLEEKGMEAMDGPINFGERDKWWGLLVDGYELEPNYNCNYNPPYYQQFFEEYGFQIYFKQFTFGRKVRDPFHPRLYEKAKNAMKKPGYRFEHFRLKEIDKYTEDFRVIYNKAWARHSGVTEMSSLQAKALMKQMKPIIDEKIIWFGYFNDEPIAFYINLPEVNQIFKYVNGKLDLIGKLKFVYHKWAKTCNKMIGLVFGVVPEHQGKGIEGALVIATAEMVQEKYPRYENLEMNWIGDFNPKMIRVVEQVGGDIVKTHHTYRKLFDETREFKRARIQ